MSDSSSEKGEENNQEAVPEGVEQVLGGSN